MTWLKRSTLLLLVLIGGSTWMCMGPFALQTHCRAVFGQVGTRNDTHSGAMKVEQSETESKHVADELLVTFKVGTSESRRKAIHHSLGIQILNTMLGGRIAHVQIPKGTFLAEIQSAYEDFPEVEAAEVNYITEIR